MLKAFSVAAAISIAATAQAASAPPPLQPSELVAFRGDPASRLTVPVSVNGRPQRFLVDTGAQRTGISTELAQSLGLTAEGTMLVTGFGGTNLIPTVRVPRIEFAKSSKTNVRAIALARSAIGADGFLGTDALVNKTVSFDFVRQQMRIRRAPFGSSDFDRRATERIFVRPHNGHLVFTDVRAGKVKVHALLDTGSSLSIGNDALRRELASRRKLGATVAIRILAVTGEVIPAEYAVIEHLNIGNVHIRNMPVAFAVAEPFTKLGLTDKPAMLLGIDALRVFNQVTIDFRNHSVRFTGEDPTGSTFWWFS